MSGPPSNLETLSKDEARLVADARRLLPVHPARREQQFASFEQRVAGRGARGRRAGWAAALLVPAAAAAAALVWMTRVDAPPAPGSTALSRVDLGEVGSVEVADGTVFTVEPDRRAVNLSSGRVRAQIAHRRRGDTFQVVSPQLRVAVVGTRFVVEAEGSLTRVAVEEGRVRVELVDGGAAVFVSAGQSLDSNDLRLTEQPPQVGLPSLEPPAPALAPGIASSPSELCLDEPSFERRKACYTKLAAATGLSAQNALRALGLLARDQERRGPEALGHWRAYEERFPDGVFAPEVAADILNELVAEKRWPEALAQAQHFGERFPGDHRAPEVALIRGTLRCRYFGELEPALQDFAAALGANVRPNVRDEALFSKGACLRASGQRGQARAAWKEYQAQFPHGAHALQAQRLLAE